MADKKDNKDKVLKDLEQELFKEFNEELNLTEPDDARLGSSVDLNPEIDNEQKEEKENTPDSSSATSAEDASTELEDETKSETSVTDEEVQAHDTSEASMATNKADTDKQSDTTDSKEQDLSKIDVGAAFQDFVSDEDIDETKADAAADTDEQVSGPKDYKSWLLAKLKQFKSSLRLAFTEFIKQLKNIVGILTSPFRWFMQLTIKEKAFLSFIFIGSVVTLWLAQFLYIEYYVNVNKSPYLTSFNEVSKKSIAYDPEENTEVFFSPAYMPDFVYAYPRIVVNIQRSSNSSRNPMLFTEIVLKGSNQSTAIEFKDRQIEIMDLISRSIERFDFDEIRSVDGKNKLKQAIAKSVNQVLNNGYVIDVLFKRFIVKP